MLSRQATAFKRNQNSVRHTYANQQFGPVAHTVIVALLLGVMGLMYLAQINKTNAFTYPINEMETKKQALLTEQSQLKVESARLGSLETVKNSAVAQSLGTPASTDTIR